MGSMVRHFIRRLKTVLDKTVATEIKAKAHKGFRYWDHREVHCGCEIAFMMPLGLPT
jgi:hypothetical protein